MTAEAEITAGALRVAEESHYKDLDALEAQLNTAMREQLALRESNIEMASAEKQLLELYLEMKDRHGKPELPEAELEAERKDLRKMSPLHILGLLRANLVRA